MAGFAGKWRRICAGAALAVLVTAGAAQAELTPDDLAPVGEANTEYQDAVWGRGIQSSVTYLKPSAPFDPDTSVRITVPEKPEERGESVTDTRLFWGIVFALILAVIIYVFVVNANGVGVSFRATGDGSRQRTTGTGPDERLPETDTGPLDQLLARLSAMADKREALILLVSHALERAAAATDVRLARAQTARDVLRVLPPDWPHLRALQGLVREAEIVHFGGRDITLDRWETCLAAARPLFNSPGGRA